MFRNNSIKKAAHPRGMPLISYTYRTCIYKPPDYTLSLIHISEPTRRSV